MQGVIKTFYTSELVAADDSEDFAVEGDVDAVVDVLPVPVVSPVVLGQPLPLDQFSCPG